MKIGIRKPSIKRSIKARTTGKLKRQVKKTINPLYGKKGMGLVNNPKKAVYNKVYSKTTIGVSDIVSGSHTTKSSSTSVTNISHSTNTSPTVWKVCGFLMKFLAVVCAVIFGLPGLFAGMFPLLIFAVIAAVAMWKLGSSWSKKGTTEKAPESAEKAPELLHSQDIHVPTATIQLSVYDAERCLAKNCDPTPVDLGKFANNSGGFTNWANYDITALNPTTKRKNKRRYKAVGMDHIKKLAEKEGLTNVEITAVLPHDMPTEKQVSYANDLGINLPAGACKEDVSAILSRVLDSNHIVKEVQLSKDLVRNYVAPLESPTNEFALFACEKGVCFSAYIGEVALLRNVLYTLELRDKLAFYAYCAVCSRNSEKIGNMLDSALCSRFYQFADNAINLEAVVRSLEGREVEDYLSPHKGTLVYKEAAKYI